MLAEALEVNGERAAAIESYERAVKLAAANRDPGRELFQRRLEAAKLRAGKTTR